VSAERPAWAAGERVTLHRFERNSLSGRCRDVSLTIC
jgi:hypothetical protein